MEQASKPADPGSLSDAIQHSCKTENSMPWLSSTGLRLAHQHGWLRGHSTHAPCRRAAFSR